MTDFNGRSRILSASEVRGFLKPHGFDPPSWLVRVFSGLSGTATMEFENYEFLVDGVEDCVVTEVLRLSKYGRGYSIRDCLGTHRTLARMGLIPFAYTINHGIVVCEDKGRRKTPRIWFYHTDETPVEWDGFTYHRTWTPSCLHPIRNTRDFCDRLERAARDRKRSME